MNIVKATGSFALVVLACFVTVCASSLQATKRNGDSLSCIRPDVFLLVKKIAHGAPVQSVDFLCEENCVQMLAALGGYASGCDPVSAISIRAYEIDPSTDMLNEIPINYPCPTELVYSVQWCCIDGIPYLAVGGCPNEYGEGLWIYKYEAGQLLLVTTFDHGATIHAVSWLCDECANDPGMRFLAIAGDGCHGVDIRMLTFTESSGQLEVTCNESHGAPVNSLDWCVRPNRCPLLVAGGKKTRFCTQNINIRIFQVSCEGSMVPVATAYYAGETVRTVAWCCEYEKLCPELAYLLVGGDQIDGCPGTNIASYCYDDMQQRIVNCSYASQPEKVFAAQWLPNCQCRRIIVGSGCQEGCVPNIALYDVCKKRAPFMRQLAHVRHDDNITSVAVCAVGDIYYVLAGSEQNNWQDLICDPLTCGNKGDGEVALYKGVFCRLKECQFKPICKRNITVS